MRSSSNRIAWNTCNRVLWKTWTKPKPINRSVFQSFRFGEFFDGFIQVTPFHFVRDYETVKVEQEVPNEFLLLFDDESQPPTANYKNIERKIILKKKRVNVNQILSFPLVVVLTNGFPFIAPGSIRQVGCYQCHTRWDEQRGGRRGIG